MQIELESNGMILVVSTPCSCRHQFPVGIQDDRQRWDSFLRRVVFWDELYLNAHVRFMAVTARLHV